MFGILLCGVDGLQIYVDVLLCVSSMTGLGLSLATVILGHLMICTPFSYGVLVSRFDGLNPDFERASMDLGEPPLATFFRVTLPLAMPVVIM